MKRGERSFPHLLEKGWFYQVSKNFQFLFGKKQFALALKLQDMATETGCLEIHGG